MQNSAEQNQPTLFISGVFINIQGINTLLHPSTQAYNMFDGYKFITSSHNSAFKSKGKWGVGLAQLD
jgi:uncharacterized membrane protein